MVKILFKIAKILIIVALIGGGAYYLIDFNKESENNYLESTKEFSRDAIDKVKEVIDSSETIQDFRNK